MGTRDNRRAMEACFRAAASCAARFRNRGFADLGRARSRPTHTRAFSPAPPHPYSSRTLPPWGTRGAERALHPRRAACGEGWVVVVVAGWWWWRRVVLLSASSLLLAGVGVVRGVEVGGEAAGGVLDGEEEGDGV